MAIPNKIGTKYEFALDSGEKAIVGDSTSPTFKPTLELFRWGEERKLKVAFPTIQAIDGSISASKVIWDSPEFAINFYDTTVGEENADAFEFEIILKQKPATNTFTLEVESDGLIWYYQPPLTQAEIDEGAIRPENVVGSYAIYHSSRGNTHLGQADAEKYRCGKAFHVYRPKVTDNAGKSIWANLSYAEGQLTITVDKIWLKKAVYPVTIDPTFGYTTAGGSEISISADNLRGSLFTSPADADTADSITVYARRGTGTSVNFKAVIVLHSNLNIISGGVSGSGLIALIDWYTATYASPPSLSPSTEYDLTAIGDNTWYFKWDAGDANQGLYDSTNSYATPTNPTDASRTISKFSIYCTYSVAPSGWTGKVMGVTNPAKICGVAVANISKVMGVA